MNFSQLKTAWKEYWQHRRDFKFFEDSLRAEQMQDRAKRIAQIDKVLHKFSVPKEVTDTWGGVEPVPSWLHFNDFYWLETKES